jgi:predicted enzyme related to lactoylglutathione lyase
VGLERNPSSTGWLVAVGVSQLATAALAGRAISWPGSRSPKDDLDRRPTGPEETPMPADLKINYLELPARDLDAVQRFYQGAFGWSFTDYGPDYRAFNDGFIDGGFYRAGAASTTDRGAALIVLYAEDLEGTRETVIRNGGEVVREIFSFPGGRRFHFADPNGNELAVWSDREG